MLHVPPSPITIMIPKSKCVGLLSPSSGYLFVNLKFNYPTVFFKEKRIHINHKFVKNNNNKQNKIKPAKVAKNYQFILKTITRLIRKTL